MSGKIKYENFELYKVKKGAEGLDVNYNERGESGDKVTLECKGKPHPDYVSALDALTEYFASRLGFLEPWEWAREAVKGDLNLLAEAKKELYDKQVARCNVSGISFVGKDQLAGVKITGSFKCDTATVGTAAPTIVFASEKLGYENTVQELCEAVRVQVFNYLFKNHRAQVDMFPPENEE